MALTFSEVTRTLTANKRVVVADVTLDNSYPTGGEAISPSDVGLQAFEAVLIPSINNAGTRFLVWDQANSKVKVLTALSTEAANASDQSTTVFRATFIGS
jgi:hypothetical protein